MVGTNSMGSADYEQEGMLMNRFLIIILSYEPLHEAQWHIVKMGLVERIVQVSVRCRAAGREYMAPNMEILHHKYTARRT